MLVDDFDLIIGQDLVDDRGLSPELVASDDDIDLVDQRGQIKGFLQGAVAPADDDDVLIAVEGSVADGAVGDAPAGEALSFGKVEFSFLRPCSNNYRPGLQAPAVSQTDDLVFPVVFQAVTVPLSS